ncbi:hypothetical protein BD324DRAFT_579243 [Kockovaella imperatae]|uniref:Uncharacterized protein n=1 Tax=Kockovaella imperatae TaxID=4999 RepID=A0A1Y1UJA1_9TREE|nr:hypothetical protein BD324DRAFT_579243 [Kockovaella imperatae]ORX37556.1 hypothetical protein BD324DRAFT_579243 [Kockovaella imperatae]
MSFLFVSRFAAFYNRNFEKRPVPTLIVTNGVLNSIADAMAQSSTILASTGSVKEVVQQYDTKRTLRFCIFGMAMGPVIGGWMRLIERGIPLRKVGGNGIQLAKRVLADQAIMAPIGLVLFVGSMGIMEGKNTTQLQEKYQDVTALLANWKVWPLIQTINFKLMPLAYRVPFQSTCGIAWTLYLSLLNAK